ncbi:MAG: aldo/keto reductase [Agathobacter sp.]|nr:aldo/keto reductase [Agathobacter sp.]
MERLKLSNGNEIPLVGFGTYKIKDSNEAYNSVKMALEAGYTHIDTAAYYENEAMVGKAIRESGIPREELFVTSKLWKTELGYEKAMAGFERTMKEIGLDYLDLYLIHWPASPTHEENWEEINLETWRAFIDIYKSGKVKAIGVSNFLPHHLKALMGTEIVPMVNQIEIQPGFMQKETVDYCRENGIIVEAWSPLGRGRVLDNPLLMELAAKYGKTVAQISLRWEVQNGIVTLPKSTHEERIKSNFDIFNFELSSEDMAKIDAMEPYGNTGHHPDDK